MANSQLEKTMKRKLSEMKHVRVKYNLLVIHRQSFAIPQILFHLNFTFSPYCDATIDAKTLPSSSLSIIKNHHKNKRNIQSVLWAVLRWKSQMLWLNVRENIKNFDEMRMEKSMQKFCSMSMSLHKSNVMQLPFTDIL